jgi:hypothetical protein
MSFKLIITRFYTLILFDLILIEWLKLFSLNKLQKRVNFKELGINPFCNISGKYALSAIQRASTNKCKQELAHITCLSQTSQLYPKSLPRYCPLNGKISKYHNFFPHFCSLFAKIAPHLAIDKFNVESMIILYEIINQIIKFY